LIIFFYLPGCTFILKVIYIKSRKTGNYHSHTVLVCQEDQGPWLKHHESVAHRWLTGSEEYVVLIPSDDHGLPQGHGFELHVGRFILYSLLHLMLLKLCQFYRSFNNSRIKTHNTYRATDAKYIVLSCPTLKVILFLLVVFIIMWCVVESCLSHVVFCPFFSVMFCHAFAVFLLMFYPVMLCPVSSIL
jgi:hypothetical protein